jgi:hypothetical protein
LTSSCRRTISEQPAEIGFTCLAEHREDLRRAVDGRAALVEHLEGATEEFNVSRASFIARNATRIAGALGLGERSLILP